MADSQPIPPSSPTARERLGGMTIDDEDQIPEQAREEEEEEEDLYSSHPLPPPRKPAPKTAPIFANWKRKQLSPPPPSSSAVDLSSDPFHPLNSSQFPAPRPREAPPRGQPTRPAAPPRILAVDIPPSSLRPLAFRIFTKKHNLTLKSEALALLCSFIGRKCGADWKTSGSAEKLLEEVARTWKRNEGTAAILVDGNDALKAVIRDLEVEGPGANKASLLTRGESFDFAGAGGMNTASPAGDDDGEGSSQLQPAGKMVIASKTGPNLEDINPKDYIHVIDAFAQPKYKYNHSRKQFERGQKPSLLPDATSKAQIFLTRYYLIHHRLLRNPSFQPPTFAPSNSMTSRGTKTYFKITPIAHLLGRSGRPFFIFGLLSTSPDTGQLMLEDPTGSIQLDITHARPIPEDGVWFCPGSFVVVDGTFEADGRFTAYTIGQPPSERRETSAEVFGHMDFLGINMPLEFSTGGGGGRGLRLAEKRLANEGKGKVVVLSQVHLDLPKTHEALTKLFEKWETEANGEDEVEVPAVVIMCGGFVSDGFGVGNGSLGYKEALDTFAVTIGPFNTLLTRTTFVLVPSDGDPWGAAFTGGASGALPRKGVPDVFPGKLKRVFTVANNAINKKDGGGGRVVLGSNPCRIGYFTREIVVFRDDLGARFVRNAVRFKALNSNDDTGESTQAGKNGEGHEMDVDGLSGANDLPSTQQEEEETTPVQNVVPDSVKMARKLVKTILDQSYLSPYPVNIRPVLWDYTHALTLFPLPNYLILADSSTPPFTVTYEGCHVVNPGAFLVADERRKARFAEFVVGAQAGAGGKVVDFVY
ncbi:DNA-directed DNA polymerase epsilon, subunit B [Arthrobotrys musiformis]|uniref:DNA polymerase epsilon subunit B n=1 Tax=Arthrobotrys musiformis TaxID=47236 RepID=A0AAV9WBS4_9PEZI